ncbi:MAG: PIN domain-containing protein [Euzebyales bacterium]|nr:PIN domain-containing protein [Euzebyales bacterium]
MALVLDTGPILALMVASDRQHAACLRMVHVTAATLVVPAATLVEVDYWVRKRLTPEVWRAFVEDVGAGAYRLEAGNETDLVRVCEPEEQYADLGLGFVDASVIALCERLGEPKVVATLDHRDFSVVVPRHVPALELLPS